MQLWRRSLPCRRQTMPVRSNTNELSCYRETKLTMTLPRLTLDDLSTLRKLACITRRLADDGAPEIKDDPSGRAFVESVMRYSAEFHERMVRELEAYEHQQKASKN
jgi:hypothetical protein